jgi:uncharacterized protein with HEPN domain
LATIDAAAIDALRVSPWATAVCAGRQPAIRSRLSIIRDNARLTQEFMAGLSLDESKADRRIFYAMTRCLEIISEAARRLPACLRDRHPELPLARDHQGRQRVSARL